MLTAFRRAAVIVGLVSAAAAAQQPDSPGHLVIAAAPVSVPAMAVIRGPVTVEGDADLHPVLGEELAETLVQQDTVGMDPQIEAADALQRCLQLRDDPP